MGHSMARPGSRGGQTSVAHADCHAVAEQPGVGCDGVGIREPTLDVVRPPSVMSKCIALRLLLSLPARAIKLATRLSIITKPLTRFQ